MSGAKSRWRWRSADAERMAAAARASGKVTALGYNYIQNPVIRHIKRLLDEGAIGTVNHVRFEMDEDFMADPEALFYWKSEASSGYGALDDFGVHPLSLMQFLFGGVSRGDGAALAMPYPDRPSRDGGRRAVETWDIASVLLELAQRRCRRHGVEPLGLGPQGPHCRADFRVEGHHCLRPGADERVPALYRRRPRHGAGFSHGAHRAGARALRPIHPGAGAWAGLQRTEDHRVPRAAARHRAARRAQIVDFGEGSKSSAPCTPWLRCTARGALGFRLGPGAAVTATPGSLSRRSELRL